MKTVEFDDLKLVKKNFSSGNFSNIHLVELNGITYCFKFFSKEYPKDIMDNICNLTNIKFDKDFLTPQFMVIKRNHILGYLSLFDKKNKNIFDLNLDYEDKIILLKNAKEKLLRLHKEYKLIHGDLNISNILSDKKLNTVFIDFDAALKFGQRVKTTQSFSVALINYLKYYKFDYKADIYRFNLTTLKFLNDLEADENIFQFLKNGLLDENRDLKRLNKELLLLPESIKKDYSGEFIIDYIK